MKRRLKESDINCPLTHHCYIYSERLDTMIGDHRRYEKESHINIRDNVQSETTITILSVHVSEVNTVTQQDIVWYTIYVVVRKY